MSSEIEPLRADQNTLNLNVAELQDALRQAIKQTGNGQIHDDVHAALESEVRIMYRNLRMYREHDDVAEIWEDMEMDAIPRLCAQRVEVDLGMHPDLGIHRGTETRIQRAPVEYLIQWATAFREILAKLDLTTPVNEGTTEEWEI